MAEIMMENGWLLDQDFQNTKIIHQNEVKLYRERAILAYLEGPFKNATLVAETPVKVEDDEGKVIGTASVHVNNGKIFAQVVIDYATPERLAAETRDGVRHWVRMIGHVDYVSTLVLDIGAQPEMRIEVLTLVLSAKRPSDRRLLPFGEPIL